MVFFKWCTQNSIERWEARKYYTSGLDLRHVSRGDRKLIEIFSHIWTPKAITFMTSQIQRYNPSKFLSTFPFFFTWILWSKYLSHYLRIHKPFHSPLPRIKLKLLRMAWRLLHQAIDYKRSFNIHLLSHLALREKWVPQMVIAIIWLIWLTLGVCVTIREEVGNICSYNPIILVTTLNHKEIR